MIAAVYVRKSTEQNGVADEQKSVTRQLEHAQQYATRKGWLLADDHVYVDDGISGAEFANRPGFLRLMNALKPRAPFQVLVMSEESRLGREAIETAYALKQLVQAGVRVFFYLEDRERTLDTPTDKIMMSLTAFADELEREKARQRTYDAMQRKAKAGHVTGGRVFGYDNLEIVCANGQRSHVERRINEAEAAVVRKIFERSAAGAGLTRIAKELNAAGALTPRPQQGRPAGWAPSTVREVLLRALYRGEIVWNQSRKRDTWGRSQRSERLEESWLRVPAPELRIVSPDLWAASQRERSKREAQYSMGERSYRASSYLLSGFARCAECWGRVRVAQPNPRQTARDVLRLHGPLEARARDVPQRAGRTHGRDRRRGARHTRNRRLEAADRRGRDRHGARGVAARAPRRRARDPRS
jgi:site-specific DNA recombinase